MAQTFEILAEPTGADYDALLAFAAGRSARFSLVWRHQLQFDGTAAVLEGELRPFLVREIQTAEWPGTTLIGSMATLRMYECSAESVSVLRTASGLYAWLAPSRPEDLAFYSLDGAYWLGSIAHERDAFVTLDSGSLRALATAVPGLRLTEAPGLRIP